MQENKIITPVSARLRAKIEASEIPEYYVDVAYHLDIDLKDLACWIKGEKFPSWHEWVLLHGALELAPSWDEMERIYSYSQRYWDTHESGAMASTHGADIDWANYAPVLREHLERK